MSKIFAERLKLEREKRGWKQEHLANLVGLTNGAISGYERNYREPDFETLNKFADIFNVSVDYLLGNDDLIFNQLSAELDEFARALEKLSPEKRQQSLDFIKYLLDKEKQ